MTNVRHIREAKVPSAFCPEIDPSPLGSAVYAFMQILDPSTPSGRAIAAFGVRPDAINRGIRIAARGVSAAKVVTLRAITLGLEAVILAKRLKGVR